MIENSTYNLEAQSNYWNNLERKLPSMFLMYPFFLTFIGLQIYQTANSGRVTPWPSFA